MNSIKKIAYISSSALPSKAANSIHVMKMCQAFANNGYDTTLYAIDSGIDTGNIYRYYGVADCFDVNRHIHGDLLDEYRIGRMFSKAALPDLFYVRQNIGAALGVMRFGKPVIYEDHECNEGMFTQYLQTKIFTHSNFSRLVVISQSLANDYIKMFPWLKKINVKVAHDGADIPVKNQIDKELNPEFRREKAFNIGYVGHLYPGKGMEIVEELVKRFPQYSFHIVGGLKEDIDYWVKRIPSANIYFHEYVPHGYLNVYFSLFDIVIAPYQNKVSIFGGKGDIGRWMSPLKIFEYMSQRKAIVASDIPVLREVLMHEENCLLCKPENIDSWDKAITRLAQDSSLRERLAETAYNQFVEKYTWKKRAQLVLEE